MPSNRRADKRPLCDSPASDETFVIIYAASCDESKRPNPAHRGVGLASERDVSRMLDLADCDGMEGVIKVLAIGNDGELHEVKAGPQRPINQDQECPVRFAMADLVTDDGRITGRVTYTDH